MTGERLSDAQKAAVRGAVAEVQDAAGLATIAARTRAGEMDQLPVMQCAFAAAVAVLDQSAASALRSALAAGQPVEDATAVHNRLAAELVTRLVCESGDENDAMVVLESVVLGVMLVFRPAVRDAGEFLDMITEQVIARLPAAAATPWIEQ